MNKRKKKTIFELVKVTRMSTYTADGVAYPFTTGSVTVAINTGSTTLSHTIAVNVDMSVVWGGVEVLQNDRGIHFSHCTFFADL